MVPCKGRKFSNRDPLTPAPSSGLPASLIQLLTLPANSLAYCVWPLWQETRVAIVTTTPGPPSWEGAVTTVAICPGFSVPTCLVHPSKHSLLLWAQIRGSEGSSTQVAGDRRDV